MTSPVLTPPAVVLEPVRAVLGVARLWLFVRESRANGKANNRGRWVEALQRIGGTVAGQPWCACFVVAVLALANNGVCPFPFSASCDDLLAHARRMGWLRDAPAPGAVCFVMAEGSSTDAVHVTLCTEHMDAREFGTIEGNASDPDAPPTREGWGCFERTPGQKGCRKRGGRYLFAHWWLPPATA